MDKKTIAWIKKTFPGLFLRVVKSPFITRLVLEIDRFRFIQCLLSHQPYFGTVCLAGQTWEERKPWMRALVMFESQRLLQGQLSLLEVGSWAGNSAVLWADAIKTAGLKGFVLCVDAWEPYIAHQDFDTTNVATRLMNEDLSKGRIFKLYLHNIKSSGHADTIFPFKGNSNRLLPRLAQESFDIIYLDGDHRYAQFMNDLHNAARILRDGGVICGDDLDLTIDQIDVEYARHNCELNVISDPKTNIVYHPGITLACHDFFGKKVENYAGFWAMRKISDRWEAVILHNKG